MWPFKKKPKAERPSPPPYRVIAEPSGGFLLSQRRYLLSFGVGPIPYYEPLTDKVFPSVEAAESHLQAYLARAAQQTSFNGNGERVS